jgi:hypothetical protein
MAEDVTVQLTTQEVVVTPVVTTVVVASGVPGPQGPQGPQGPPGDSASRYEHEQITPAATWIINHNLGHTAPCQLFNTDNEIVYADVVQGTLNTTTVTFPAPIAGKAVLS